MADTKTAAAPAEQKPTSVAELSAAFPDLVSQIRADARKEGADAERQRIGGIEDMAKGRHASLVADMKSDGKTTPEQAAVRILAADNESRDRQMQGIKDVEQVTAVVNPAPTGAPRGEAPKTKASTPDGWKAEYEASAELQREFGSAASYVSYQEGVAAGRIRILNTKAS